MRQRKQQMGLSGDIKGMEILLAAKGLHQQAHPQLLGISHLKSLQPVGTLAPQLLECHTHIPHHHVTGSLCVLPPAVQAGFGRQIVSTHRKLAQICQPERNHKTELPCHLWEDKG